MGWDSYFYIGQAKTWIQEGHLHSSRLNLIYPLLIVTQFLMDDYVTSYFWLSILAMGLLPVLVYVYVNQLMSNSSFAFLIALFFLFNPQLVFFASQFTKNLLGIDVFFLVLIFRKKWILSALFMVVLFFTHKLMFACGVCFFVFYYLAKLTNRRISLVVLMTGWIVFQVSWYFVFPNQSTALHVPALSFLASHGDSMNFIWKVSVVFMIILFVSGGSYLLIKGNRTIAAFVSVLLFLNSPIIEWSQLGVSYRMQMVFLVLVPVCIVVVQPKFLYSVFLVPLAYSSFITYQPVLQDPPYIEYDFISQKLLGDANFQQSELVIAHKSLAEYLSFVSDKDVLPWAIPQEEINEKVYRIVYLPLEDKVQKENELGDFVSLSARYLFTAEEEWRYFLNNVGITEENWKNPFEIRPSHMK